MRFEIARLVDTNFDNQTKFLTLTFRENIQDIAYANNEFKKNLSNDSITNSIIQRKQN